MTVEKLIDYLSKLPLKSEVLIDIENRKAEIKDVHKDIFNGTVETKTFVIIDIYK